MRRGKEGAGEGEGRRGTTRSLLTAQMSVQACSSEFTRYPPHSVSVSSLADSASCVLGSSPTATTTWSASSCERKEGRG